MLNKRRALALSFIILFLALATFAQSKEVIIIYKNNTEKDYRISSTIDLEGSLNVTQKFTIVDGFVADVSKGEKEILEKNKDIIISEIQQYHAILDVAVPLINATDVQRVQLGGQNITGSNQAVCVLDTGVDYTHAAFGNCWGNNNESSDCVVVGGYDFVDDDDDPVDEHITNGNGHGTHVAGIIASQDLTYKGVAPSSKIIAMRVLDSSGAGSDPAIASAMEWCINNRTRFNITAISLSLGNGAYETSTCTSGVLDPLIQSAISNNISVVVSAGNCELKSNKATCDGTVGISSPACLSGVIPVGAVNDADTQYYQRWSNWEILAPGIGITSLKYPGGGTQTLSGTSMAAPFVSATIALLQQYSNLKNNRSLNSTEIQTALNTTDVRINDTATGTVYPRLDAHLALTTLTNPQFTSINHANLSTVNSSTPTLDLEIVFNEEVDFLYSINGSENKTGCTSCTTFNQTIALPRFGNLSFNFYIEDSVGNKNSADRVIYINQTASTFNTSYIGEQTILFIAEDTSGEQNFGQNLTIYINQTNNLSITYPEGNYTVNLTDSENQTIIYFNYSLNETSIILDLSSLVVMKGNLTGNKSYTIIRGLNLTNQSRTKTVYLKKNIASNNTCIKDAEVFSSGEISTYCNGSNDNEYRINCPGINGTYSCNLTNNNTYYEISGLSNSAIAEMGDFCGDGIINNGEDCDGGSSCDSNCQIIVVPAATGDTSGGGGGGGEVA